MKAQVAAAAVLAVLAAGGCGGEGKSPDARPTVDVSDKVPSGDNGDLFEPRGAIGALSGFRCAPNRAGVWKAAGTLSNDGKTDRRYLVTVSVVRTETSEVLGAVQRTYPVLAGASLRIALARVFSDPKQPGAKGRSCVPRVVAGG